MRKRQSSFSAMGIAIVRAIESEKPEGERVCYDPYARKFVNGALFHFVRFFDRLGYGEIKGPGVMGFLVVRDRYIDDFLQERLDEGLAQLVLLGAGYDSRAYRFEQLKQGVQVFEVDHPASQEAKLKVLRKVMGQLPAYVTYVPIDFNEQKLEDELLRHGYNPALKTLFIWQGVTEYLTPEAVDGTLQFIAQRSGPGSTVIFDYMDPALLHGVPRHGEVSNMRRYRWMSGEELTFGIPIGEMEAFLEARGFTEIKNADHRVLKAAYFAGQKRSVADGYAIASGRVK